MPNDRLEAAAAVYVDRGDPTTSWFTDLEAQIEAAFSESDPPIISALLSTFGRTADSKIEDVGKRLLVCQCLSRASRSAFVGHLALARAEYLGALAQLRPEPD